MDSPPFQTLISGHPTLELLRAQHAPLILDFLWFAYRHSGEVVRSQSWLEQHLSDRLESHQSPDDKEEPAVRARRYINTWCDRQFLRNYMDDQSKEMRYVLTSYTEKAFQMIELLQERAFVATESRFQDILSKLQDMVRYGQMDTQARIEELEKQRDDLDQQITRLREGAEGFVMADYQIRSRYEDVLRLISELTGDFREVEENFRGLTRRIYAEHAEGRASSGKIMGHAFDALDKMRASDQGKSFYTFWHFLNDEHANQVLQKLTQQVHGILTERHLPFTERALRYLKRTLYSAGQRVIQSNEHLAHKLVQIVAEENLQARKHNLELMRAIRQRALKLVAQMPEAGVSLELEILSPPHLPLERKLKLKPVERAFAMSVPQLMQEKMPLAELQKFYRPWQVDRTLLRQQLQALLRSQQQITLPEVLRIHPLHQEKGLTELLAWLSLMQSEPHTVDAAQEDHFVFGTAQARVLHIPRIIFVQGGR